MEKSRKKDHIDMAFQAQMLKESVDLRFYYEPFLNPHPDGIPVDFKMAEKNLKAPIWVSSMTGGTKSAGKINSHLAKACKEFGLGMGLGSCRVLLDDDTHFSDFNMRDIIGDESPLYANLGVAQIEKMLHQQEIGKIEELIVKLRADGLIIHVNPLQEWFQPEGDRFTKPPIETIAKFLQVFKYPVIVKEVGQGMGYYSLKALLELPLLAVEFAAFGGTNFAKMELMRSFGATQEYFGPLAKVGHDAYQMTEIVNHIVDEGNVETSMIIISGGIKNFLDGYYLINRSKLPSIYGQASGFLKYATENYDSLRQYIEYQIKGLELAYAFLKIRE